MLNITQILMDYEKEQTGITHVPQFSWTFESDKRNVMQQYYSLVIAKDAAFSEKVYESGKVESDASAQVEPENVILQSQKRYFVKVTAGAAGEG